MTIYDFSRPIWEGGQYAGDEKSRLDALRLAMELGADHIDVELKVAFYLFSLHFSAGKFLLCISI